VLPLLGRSHQVFAPDLPSYSPASAPAGDYSPARLARFVLSFMDAVGLDTAAVAGNPPGGLAALHLALSQPERVSALCLVEATVGSLRAVLGPFGQRQVLAKRLADRAELHRYLRRRQRHPEVLIRCFQHPPPGRPRR
jgi:pimeloyl-ACP methyl ester carboxylesterase